MDVTKSVPTMSAPISAAVGRGIVLILIDMAAMVREKNSANIFY